jgi:tRNA nucleotidyltransferase (CCA-adding enzyme)
LYSLGDGIKANGEKEFSHVDKFGKIEFEVYFEHDLEEYNIAFYCESPEIDKSYLRRGPPSKDTVHSKKFKKKNPNFFEKEGYFCVETIREHNLFLEYLKDFVSNKIPDNLKIVNLANSKETLTISGRKCLYVLIHMVLPFT